MPDPLVLALGDSLTAGYGLAPEHGFAARLERMLRASLPHARVQNAGVSGDTTVAAAARLPRLLAMMRRRPALAVVELGANDLLRGLPPARTRAALAGIVEELQRCAIPVLLATVEPPPFLAQVAGGYAGIYAAVAAAHGVATCPFFPPNVLGHPDLVLADRLHPNARAIELCARGVLPHVLAMLAATEPAAAPVLSPALE